jgi:hypothetical protein
LAAVRDIHPGRNGVGGFVGLQFGGRTMMRHVGEREYRSRIAASKTVSSLWSYWWRDAK